MIAYILFFIFFLPFLFAFNPSPGIDFAASRFASMFLFTWWLARKIRKKESPQFDFWHVLFAAFLAMSFLSVFVADLPLWSLRKALVFFSFFPLYMVVRDVLLRHALLAERIPGAIFFSGVLVAVLGILEYLGQFFFDPGIITRIVEFAGPRLWGVDTTSVVLENKSWFVGIGDRTYLRAFLPFPDPHSFAMYLGLSFPMGAYLFLKDHSLKKSLFLLFFLSVLLSALFFSFSRAAYLGVLVMFPALVALSWRHAFSRIKIAGLTLCFLVFLFFVLSPAIPFSNSESLGAQRFETTLDTSEGSNKGRIDLWKLALGHFLRQPILGVGIGNFPRVVDPNISYRSPINAHNTYLDIAVEMGGIALGIWLLLLLGTMVSLFRIRSATPHGFFLSAALLGSLTYFGVHSFLETALYSPSILPLLLILFAVAHHTTRRTTQNV